MITLPAALAAVALALLLLLVPPAHGQNGSVAWIAPTRADNSRFTVTTGKSLTLTLAASTSRAAEVSIEPVLGLPPGATVSNYADNGKSRAVFRWRPTEVGDYTLKFVASTGPGASAPPLTYLIRVNPDIRYPHSYTLTDAKIGHWAKVLRRTVVRSQPRSSARAVTTLDLLTPDDTQNLVLVLGGVDQSPTKTWYRIRLAILPNNSTGWVPKEALGDLVTVTTHLYIDRAKFTITLERNGTHDLQDERRRRALLLADATRRVLHPGRAHGLRLPGLRADRVRDERTLHHADRLAGRRRHRHPRDESARAPPRVDLARLRPDAQRRHPEAGAADQVGTPLTIR